MSHVCRISHLSSPILGIKTTLLAENVTFGEYLLFIMGRKRVAVLADN